MPVTRRQLLGGSALLGSAGLLAACGGDTAPVPASPSPGPTIAGPPAYPGGVLNWSQPAAFEHLDPHTAAFGGGFPASLVYDTLFRVRPSDDPALQEVEPHLAASFEQPEPTLILLHIAPGARFHTGPPTDGRPLVAEDVVFSLRRLTSGQPEFIHRQSLEPLQDIDVPEAGIVQLRLSSPWAPLLRHLAAPWPAIVPHELLELYGDLKTAASGTGPYRVTSIDGGSLDLERSGSWWKHVGDATLPNIDRITLRSLPRANDRLDALLDGTSDWAPFVPFDRAGEIDANPGLVRADYPLQDFQYVRLRSSRGPLRDVRVRRALALAIDRRAIIATAFGGRGVPHAVLPPSVAPWAMGPDELAYHRFDPEQAAQLLRAAGFEEELHLTNLAPDDVPLQNAYATAVIAQWAAIDVRVTDQALPYKEYLKRTYASNFEVNIHWGNRYDDIDGYLSEYETGGTRNLGAWGDDALDAIIETQRRESGPDARRELVARAQSMIAESAWTIGVASWLNTDAWTSRLREARASADPFAQTRWLAEAWLTG